MFDKPAHTSVPIHDTLARRWSGRAYDARRPVPRDQLLALFEAARWAPSCYGDQPWRMVVCDRFADAAAWQRALDCLVEGNQSWARYAPLIGVVAADTQFRHNDEPNRWAQYDSGAAAMSLCVQAAALGLMVHQMGGFDPARAAAAFAIPERCTPMAMFTVGWQLAQEDIPHDMRERELAPRRRHPLGELFFASTWGNGLA